MGLTKLLTSEKTLTTKVDNGQTTRKSQYDTKASARMSNPDFVTSVPTVGQTTCPTTRQATLEHMLNILDVQPETINELRNEGIVNIQRLRMVSDDRLLDFVTRLPNFTIGDQMSIEAFQLWANNYEIENNMEPEYMIEFTEDEYNSTIREMVKDIRPRPITTTTLPGLTTPRAPTTPFTLTTPTINSTINQNGTENPNTKASIKDYPKFNGSLDRWREFCDQFSAAADVHGYGRILDESYTPPDATDAEYEAYTNANRFIYVALKYSVATGTARTQVAKHHREKDGRAAWISFVKWYESQGSANNVAKRALKDIQTYKLTATTLNGAEGFISRFETNLQEHFFKSG